MNMIRSVVFTDDNSNFYGVLKVDTVYSKDILHKIISNIIIDEFGNSTKFFNYFSENLSTVIEVLDKDENVKVLEFEYMNSFSLNVDRVFDIDRELLKGKNVKNDDIKYVVNVVSDMLNNNVELGLSGMGEHFVDWCENGDIFGKGRKSKVAVMKAICFEVDRLSNRLLKLFNIVEED